MYNNISLKEEEIFFGFIWKDGRRSSMVKRQPTLSELKILWEKYPIYFARTCECGEQGYVYSHIVVPTETEPYTVIRSYVSLICPHCGRRLKLGANFFRAQLRNGVIDGLVPPNEY